MKKGKIVFSICLLTLLLISFAVSAVSCSPGTNSAATPSPLSGGTQRPGNAPGEPGMSDMFSTYVPDITDLWMKPDTKVFNLLDFGAEAGNDATGALQQAVDTILAQGEGILYIPSGVYYLSDTVVVPETKNGSITILGESSHQNASKLVVTDQVNPVGIRILADHTKLAYLTITAQGDQTVSLSLEADDCLLYTATLTNTNNGFDQYLLEVSGSENRIVNANFGGASEKTHSVRFTKHPGRACKNNVLADSLCGGAIDAIVIDSQDSEGCPENIQLNRMVLLNYRGSQLEIRSGKNITISNSMLDQGYHNCVRIAPEGIGIDGVVICENYIATAYNYGIQNEQQRAAIATSETSDAAARNIEIANNMIVYSDYGLKVDNENVTHITLRGNQFSDMLYSVAIKKSIGNILEANIFSNIRLDSISEDTIFRNNIILSNERGSDLSAYQEENTFR